MATTRNPSFEGASALPEAGGGVDAITGSRLGRWLWPSFADLLFIALPFWFFGLADGGAGRLLFDGDTGWHIRTGDWILSHARFVHQDMFSFSKPGQPWFAWEWLSDVIFSLLHASAGMKGILLFGILFSSLFCGLIFRHMVWRGANLFVALPLALMGFGSATIHLLARPHLWTLLLVAASWWLIQADLRSPTRWIWALVPLTAVWTNLHGGWVTLVILLGLVASGTAIESWLGQAEWSTVRRYWTLAAACMAVSLLNPYGWRLHAHLLEYLGADWIKNMVSEFQSPSFRSENAMQYELILLASMMATALLLGRRRFVSPLVVLFWAHSSLVSARHIPIFVVLALPVVADELQGLWQAWTGGAARKSTAGIFRSLAEDAQSGLSRTSLWPAATFVLVCLPLLPIPWPVDFPKERFPTKVVAAHADLLAASRVLAEDQWGDYLIYKNYPRQRVYFDGRSDYYGEKATKEYARLIGGGYDWAQLTVKYSFQLALLLPTSPLASLLKMSPDWRVVQDDGKAILFERVPAVRAGAENPHRGANEIP